MKLSKAIALSSLLVFSASTIASCTGGDQNINVVDKTITGIKITNKESLTKDFYLGDEARTIEATLTPSTYTFDKALADGTLKIASSDSEIIKVVGKTIQAVKKGSATITLSSDKASDSFTVNVKEKENKPEPTVITDITVTNYDNIVAKWTVGDADRVLEVKLTPETFSFDEELSKGTIKVTSSNSRVVAVEGKTLKAVGAGVATITVKSDLAYQDIEINVSEKVVPIETISILNKEELQKEYRVGDLDRTLEVKIAPEKYNFDDCLENGLITITSSNEKVISVTGKTIKALKDGTSTIKVEGMGIFDEVELTVLPKLIGTPTINVDTTKLYVMTGSELVLPTASAASSDGVDLSSSIKISDDKESVIEGNKFTSTAEGEHTLIYQIADPNDPTKIAKASVKVEVCRKLFTEDGTPSFTANELTEKANQSYTVTDSGEGTKLFNIAPSKLYYAEAVMTMPEQGTNFWHGMAHYAANKDPNYRWMLDTIRNENDLTHLYLDAENWNTSGDKWMFNINDTRDIPVAQADKTVKYAVARDGNVMYTFINDTFVTSTTDVNYFDKDTVPGFFTFGQNNAAFTMTATNIDYFGGNQAKDKIQSLMGTDRTKLLTPYKNFDITEKDYVFKPFDNEEKGLGYTLPEVGPDTDPNNGNCNCYNTPRTLVKIETLFTGSWRVAWDWRLDSTVPCEHKQEAHHNVDVRRWHYGGEIARVGLEKQTPFEALKTWAGQGWGGEVNTADFDFSLGYHFEIKRECQADKDIYTWIIASVKDPTQVQTGSFEYKDGDHGEPVYILFHNDGVTGELSHLIWENI